MKKITSLSNPDIKRIRSLALRKYREETGLFIAEGLRHAIEAAEAGWEFDTLVVEDSAQGKALVKDLVAKVQRQEALLLDVSQGVMESITRRDNAQAVVAVLKQRWAELKDVKTGVWVGLEEIRDPGNLGTILRTCDAVAAEGVILIGNTCDPYSLEAVRASMGSFPHVKLVRCTREEFIKKFAAGFQVIGTHLKTEHDYKDIAYKKPLVLLMGNEQAGLTDEMAGACTDLVKIPMLGKADSLNVSVAAAIMLYETIRAR
jgi:TrmH family RNA methyltransferase